MTCSRGREWFGLRHGRRQFVLRSGSGVVKLVLLGGGYFLDRRDKPIPVARQGLDEAGIVRGVAQGLPEPHDGGIQAMIEVDECVIGPKPLSQLLSCNDFASLFEQDGENATGLFLEPDLTALLAEFTGPQIHFVYAEADKLLSQGRLFHGSQLSRGWSITRCHTMVKGL